MARRTYPTDLTDDQWAILDPSVPAPKPGRRPAIHPSREVANAMRSVLRGGIAWRLRRHEFPPWRTVDDSFRQWRTDGTCNRNNMALRERVRGSTSAPRRCRSQRRPARAGPRHGWAARHGEWGHHGQPIGEDCGKRVGRGYDDGKKVTGRTRHILVDTIGSLLTVRVHPAAVQDRDGAKLLRAELDTRCPRLAKL